MDYLDADDTLSHSAPRVLEEPYFKPDYPPEDSDAESVSQSSLEVLDESYFKPDYPLEDSDAESKRQQHQPDRFGEEMADNARVWRVYRDAAWAQDQAQLDGWNKTLDILLIFAGLFSAVATAFIVESYKLLQPDYEEYIAGALVHFLASANGSALSSPSSAPRAPQDFQPSRTALWVNGLWFTSLSLALAVALLCILVKQWVETYSARVTAHAASSRHWAHRRIFYSEGLTKWRVSTIVFSLPVLLHAAVFLFFAGLVVLLWQLNVVIAAWQLIMAAVLVSCYATTAVLPLVNDQCPFSMPIARELMKPARALASRTCVFLYYTCSYINVFTDWKKFPTVGLMLRGQLHSMATSFLACLQAVVRCGSSLVTRLKPLAHLRDPVFRADAISALFHMQYRLGRHPSANPWRTAMHSDDFDVIALKWMVASCPDMQVGSSAFRALGAVRPWGRLHEGLHTYPYIGQNGRALQYLHSMSNPAHTVVETVRIARSILSALDHLSEAGVMSSFTTDLQQFLRPHADVTYDQRILQAFIVESDSKGPAFRALVRYNLAMGDEAQLPQPFLTSTALLILASDMLDLDKVLHLLHAMDLRVLDYEDWYHVLARVRGGLAWKLRRGRQEYYPCYVDTHNSDKRCGIRCAFSAFSSCLTNGPHKQVDIVLRLMIRALRIKELNAEPGGSDSRSVYGAIASPLFFSRRWSPKDLRALVEAWHFNGRGQTSCDRNFFALTAYGSAMVSLIHHTALNAQHLVEREEMLTDRITYSLISAFKQPYKASDTVGVVSSYHPILETLPLAKVLLQPSEASRASPWQMLQNLSVRLSYLLKLANVLCASLYMLRMQGEDVSIYVEELFAAPCWAAFGSIRQGHDRATFNRLCEHCQILRPDWEDFLPSVLGRLSPNLYGRLEEVTIEQLRQIGPCPTCTA